MKIIHCADIHLDSALNSNLEFEKAKTRKNEILLSFGKMIDYAVNNKIGVVIIAGDLFDSENVSIKTERYLLDKIAWAKDVEFLYLKGNHDLEFNFKEELPENLKLFENDFSVFEYGNVKIGGISLINKKYENIEFESQDFNIAVAHGTTDNSSDEFYVNLKLLQNKNIDYLALGHIHKMEKSSLDDRGVYAQCGCLDGRGFDECGEKGFMLIDTDENSVDFVEMSSRIIYEKMVDISAAKSTLNIIKAIENALEGVSEKSIVRVVLEGKTDNALIKDFSLIKSTFKERYFSFSLKDNSSLFIDYNEYKNDISLKGEFLRLVLDEDMPDSEREKTISAVINALNSEELGI